MLFFVFLSFVAMPSDLPVGAAQTVRSGRGCPSRSGGSRIASRASRLRGPHRGSSVFVDLDHVASGVRSTREPFEAFRAPEDDRVGVCAGLDCAALLDLLVEERVEAVPANP